ncbi:hypothetical protein Avbf_09803 [Armadillidium vulgare]|nr:hypothetical protein Avbf_09803 [Armadillidium vulgare]
MLVYIFQPEKREHRMDVQVGKSKTLPRSPEARIKFSTSPKNKPNENYKIIPSGLRKYFDNYFIIT